MADITIAETPNNLKPQPSKDYSQKIERIIRQWTHAFLSASDIPIKWMDKTMDMLEKGSSARKIADKLISWDYKKPPIITLLSANNGVGKTHVGMVLYRKYIYEYYSKEVNRIFARTTNEEDLIRELTSRERYLYDDYTYNKVALRVKDYDVYTELQEAIHNNKTEKSIMRKYITVPFLFYDDMFAVRESEQVSRNIYYLLEERVSWRGLPTVITTNLSPEAIKGINPRIISRLSEGLILSITDNKNYRKYAEKI